MIGVNFVVALRCEAGPLIGHFRLRRIEAGAAIDGSPATGRRMRWRVYGDGRYRLIVSGVGKAASAAATSHLARLGGSTDRDCWVNVGLAGHPSLEVGEAMVAHTIKDEATGRIWRPRLPAPLPAISVPLLTVDAPQSDYLLPWAFDMEAAGFVAAVAEAVGAGQAGCLKIISDNRHRPLQHVTPDLAARLVAGRLDAIDALANGLAPRFGGR